MSFLLSSAVSAVPVHISWWSDEVCIHNLIFINNIYDYMHTHARTQALILASGAGEVCVLSIHSLRNLLSGGAVSGWTPTPAANDQFFLLEVSRCEAAGVAVC